MRQQSNSRRVVAFATTALATLMASAVQAAIDVPRVPLQSGTAVPPNIMFIIDDSGSMAEEQAAVGDVDPGSASLGPCTALPLREVQSPELDRKVPEKADGYGRCCHSGN